MKITDNEPTVQFSAAAYSASEAAKSMAVTVTDRPAGGSWLPCDTTSLAAPRSTEAWTTTSRLPGRSTFAVGKSLAQTLPITLNPDTIADGPKTIDLDLTELDGRQGGHAGLDGRDHQGQRQGRQGPVLGSELFRGGDRGCRDHHRDPIGGTSSEATVHYSTSDGSAAAPTDDTTSASTLTFGLNEKSKTFTVPVVDDGTPDWGAVSVNLLSTRPPTALPSARTPPPHSGSSGSSAEPRRPGRRAPPA